MDTQFSSGPRRQSSHHLQPLTSLGYIPQQAIQTAGYDYNTYRMYSLNPNISNLEQDPLLNHNHSMEAIHHEAMQRQLEKQKIREEIIQAENKRRRMLEAEVRRELMMERQMLLQHHGYTAEERPLDGYTSDYRPFELVDDRLPFVDRVDSWATKDPWAFLGSSADKFSFVDRVDDKPSKERFSLRNHSDFIRPIATEEQWKVPNQSSRNEIPSYNRTQPYYPEPMIPKVNSALWESQPYNYMRPEASLAPNNPEGHLAHKDLMPYMRPEVIPAPISSHPYMQPYVFSNSAPSVPGPYSKAMQVQMNSKANETFQGISNKSASGMKRKASYGSSSNIYKKKKLDGGWSCTLCQISATSEKTLDGHFYGRKHKENEEQLREKKTKNEAKHKKGKTVVKEESLNQIKPQVNNDVKSKDGPQSETPRKFFKFWCKHCQFGADTKVQLNDHNKGKRHFLNLQEKSVAEVSTPAP